MTKIKNTSIERKKEIIRNRQYPLEISIVALISFVLFPYVLAVYIMMFLKSANSILIDVSFFFSLVIGIACLICGIICLKFYQYTFRAKMTKVISIINIVLSSLMCFIGVFEFFYYFGIIFPYMMILLDGLIIMYVPIAIIVMVNLIVFLILHRRDL
ncbi:MAG: hypothetical protein LBF36_02975 [Mycoplasmataceae bacterium]|jgi:hypothetical protein|nr:hypothetical protein [Mycoplasmataceae bacterium]